MVEQSDSAMPHHTTGMCSLGANEISFKGYMTHSDIQLFQEEAKKKNAEKSFYQFGCQCSICLCRVKFKVEDNKINMCLTDR